MVENLIEEIHTLLAICTIKMLSMFRYNCGLHF